MCNYIPCFLIVSWLASSTALHAGYSTHTIKGHTRQGHELMQPTVHVSPSGNRRPMGRNHFDTAQFCEDFTLGKAVKDRPAVSSFVLLRDTVAQEVAVLRCVAAVEILALPHNILQDFRWTVTHIRRHSGAALLLRQLFLLPFTLVQTIAALPLNIFKQMGRTIVTILTAIRCSVNMLNQEELSRSTSLDLFISSKRVAMDLRIYFLILALISLSVAVQNEIANGISNVQGETTTSVDIFKTWMTSKAFRSILNTTVDNRNDHYFDSFTYCLKSVVGPNDTSSNTEDVRSKFTERQFIVKTLLLIKCVAVTDAVTIPYNVFQDVKQSLVEVRREFSWEQFVHRILMIPYVVIRSAMEQPSRALNNVLGFIMGSIFSYFSVYA